MDGIWRSRHSSGSNRFWPMLSRVRKSKSKSLTQIIFSVLMIDYICQNLMASSWSGQGACVGLYFINKPEWPIVDYACSAYSFISVPLYDTLGMYVSCMLVIAQMNGSEFNRFSVYGQAWMQLSTL